MPVEDINYIEKNGIYYIKLSRAELEEFIQYASSFDNIKPSINSFARRKAIHTDILEQDARVIVDFSINNSQEVVDLSGLNFSNLDISDVKFSGANMQGCKFENAILDSADFGAAILDKAIFRNCRAREAKFIKAKLNNVSIINSEFREVYFTDSQAHSLKIINSNLDQAVIRNADWDQAMIVDSNLSNCFIDNSNMANTTFDKIKLHDISARKVILHQATIKSNCSIKNIDLSEADLTYAKLQNCQISDADLAGANLLKANFDGVNISTARPDKAWYLPSSETVIKNTMRATKVAVGAAKVVNSGANFTKKIFSKLWGSSAPAVQKPAEEPLVQKPAEEPLAQSDVSKSSNSKHYKNIVNTLNSTRLVAEDFNQAKSAVSSIIKLCEGLFDQDYFFPRANNYQNLLAQIKKAHKKGYIDSQYKNEFFRELKEIKIDNQKYTILPKEVLDSLVLHAKSLQLEQDIINELERHLPNNEAFQIFCEAIMPGQIAQEINKLQAPKIAEIQQYYLDRHAEFTHYMLKNRVEKLAKEGVLNPQEKDEYNEQLRDKEGKFEAEINRDLEKKILQLSAEKLKPFLHVLSDPALFELMKLLGEGQNREQTLAAWVSLQENYILQKLGISEIVKGLPIDNKLLKYVGIVPSIVSLIIPMMSHEKEFPIILSDLQDMFRKGDALGVDGNKRPNQAMNAISAICSLLQQDPTLRRLFTEEIEPMTQVLLSIFERQIQDLGLQVDLLNKVITFSTKLAQQENTEIFWLLTEAVNLIQNPKGIIISIVNQEKYLRLRNVVQDVLPRFIENQHQDIRSLLEQFLMRSMKGVVINNKIAAILGVNTTESLKLLDGYMSVISSAVKIAGAMINHKDEFLGLARSVSEVLNAQEATLGQYCRLAVAGISLLKKDDVRQGIAQALPEIFVATNGVLEKKLKSFGLSQSFAEGAVNLVAKIVISDEVSKILEFANELLVSGMIINKGVLEVNASLDQMLKGLQSSDYKSALQGFALLVGEAGKYKELKTLVQETLPKLIQDNKEQIIPLIEEFIQQTELGKRINIDVNDILKIASEKNQNLLKFTHHWAQENYMGVVKETVKLLTSPIVVGFLVEIAGKAAWSYLFDKKQENIWQSASVGLDQKLEGEDSKASLEADHNGQLQGKRADQWQRRERKSLISSHRVLKQGNMEGEKLPGPHTKSVVEERGYPESGAKGKS